MMQSAKPTAFIRERMQAPSDLHGDAVANIAAALKRTLADVFVLYIKTKSFHWHMSGPHFRDYHMLLDEQAGQIFAMTDDIAERARKIGGMTIRSVGDIARHSRILDNDTGPVEPHAMLAELGDDNRQLVALLRETHGVCEEFGDVATASLIENWIDEGERRVWFLYETTRSAGSN